MGQLYNYIVIITVQDYYIENFPKQKFGDGLLKQTWRSLLLCLSDINSYIIGDIYCFLERSRGRVRLY